MSEMNIIKASVSYQATVDSVIWKGYDALTREYSLKDTVDVEIPAGSHPHYALVLIADSISKQHQMEISGKLISPVLDLTPAQGYRTAGFRWGLTKLWSGLYDAENQVQ
jgi:hypothetical protein